MKRSEFLSQMVVSTAGVPAAGSASQTGSPGSPEVFIERIPYLETRGYIRTVVRNRSNEVAESGEPVERGGFGPHHLTQPDSLCHAAAGHHGQGGEEGDGGKVHGAPPRKIPIC